MTFLQAKNEVRALVPDEYIGLRFSVDEHADGVTKTTCEVYANGLAWFSGPTWELAIQQLTNSLNGVPATQEAPQGDY